MPVFHYKAMTESGLFEAGRRSAPTRQALLEELEKQGLWVRHIRRPSSSRSAFFRRRIGRDTVLLFVHEFSALLRAGLTVTESLTTVADRRDAPRLGAVLTEILEQVRSGESLSSSASHFPEAFDEVFLAALRTGEATGDLSLPLQRYGTFLRERIAIGKRLSQALTYPLFLLVTLAVILGLLFTFVVPRFVALYADFGAELPLATRILAAVVHHADRLALAAAVIGAAGWLLTRTTLRSPNGREFAGRLRLALPLFGPLHRSDAVSRLTGTLATLLASGMPLVQAMDITRTVLTNAALAAGLERAVLRVTEGQSLARALREEELVPETGLKLVEAGEASGNLETMLDEISRYYREVMEHRLARMLALVEPSLLLLMGVLVGGIIVAMYLPIFGLTEVLQ